MAKKDKKNKEPIYVTDKKDPRLLAYIDSLNLYNLDQAYFKALDKSNKDSIKKANLKYYNNSNVFEKTPERIKLQEAISKLDNYENKKNEKIKNEPKEKNPIPIVAVNSSNTIQYSPIFNSAYKKPVQPVKLKKLEPVIQSEVKKEVLPIQPQQVEPIKQPVAKEVPKYSKREWVADGTGDTYIYKDNTGKELGRETYQKGKLVTPSWDVNNIMDSKDNANMKKYKYGTKKIPKYAQGIQNLGTSQWGAMNNAAQGMGAYTDSISTDVTGRQTEFGGAASGAMKGAGYGMALAPMTGGLSIAAGALIGGIGGYFGAKNENESVQASEDAQRIKEAAGLAERQRQEQQIAAQQQLNYSRSYYTANPASGQVGSSVYAYGTKKLPNTAIMAEGGSFSPVSSNVAVVNGKTHAQGGVDLVSNGIPIAEVEKDETIINGQSVASDITKLPNGKTIAEESIRIGKGLAKVEKDLNSSNTLKANSANRTTDNLNKELATILDYQEQVKAAKGIKDGNIKAMGGNLPKYLRGTNDIEDPNHYDTTQAQFDRARGRVPLEERLKFNPNIIHLPEDDEVVIPEGGIEEPLPKYMSPNIFKEADALRKNKIDSAAAVIANTGANAVQPDSNKFNYAGIPNAITGMANAAAPYLDNAANLRLISKAPQVSTPNMERAVMAQANPLKTTYNINPQLNMATKAYKDYMKNVDDNTSNSAVARGNKLAAFSKTLENKSALAGQKENMENQLINQDSLNRQRVSDYNTQSTQNTLNRNLAKLDGYDNKKEARLDDNRRELSKNAANLSSDMKTNLYDTDRKRVYHEQMLYDALSKRDGAAVSELIGSDYMNSFVGDEKNYKMIEQNLKDQPLYLKKFYETYSKR